MSDQSTPEAPIEHKVPESKPTPWLGIGVVAVIVLLGAYVIKTNKQNAAKTAPTSPTAQTQPAASPSAGQTSSGIAAGVDDSKAKVFTVDAANFTFTPNVMKVKKGDTVKIIFDNKEGFHNLLVDEFNVKTKTIKANETDTVEFVADKSGSFQYYCSVGNHRKMGMWGTLTVQ